MTEASSQGPTRAAVWKRLGAPTDQIGSVNEPRTHEEYGVRWNEKWIYRAENSQEIERVVLWYRYDFQGAFRVKPDGSAEPEALPRR
jgi:hypothetical protein